MRDNRRVPFARLRDQLGEAMNVSGRVLDTLFLFATLLRDACTHGDLFTACRHARIGQIPGASQSWELARRWHLLMDMRAFASDCHCTASGRYNPLRISTGREDQCDAMQRDAAGKKREGRQIQEVY